MPGRFALIVANDAYEDAKLRRLRAPAYDAAALTRVLSDPAIGGFEVTLSTNEPDAALRRRIAAFFSDRRRDDLLLLHFSSMASRTTAVSCTSRRRIPTQRNSKPRRCRLTSSATR